MADDAATGNVVLFGGEASYGALGGPGPGALSRRGDREPDNRESPRVVVAPRLGLITGRRTALLSRLLACANFDLHVQGRML